MNHISDYRDVYEGRTVFIIGNGIELNQLDSKYFTGQVTIGVNASYLYLPNMDFYIAGHALFPLLWDEYAVPKMCNVFHGSPTTLSLPNTIVSTYNKIASKENLHYFKNEVTKNDPLVGNDMCAFSATHLALIIGAKRIVYIGFDLKHRNHFYDFDPYYWHFEAQIRYIHEKHVSNSQYNRELLNFRRNHFPPTGDDLWRMFESYPLYKRQYQQLFFTLRGLGIQVYATQEDSIVAEAGATVVSIESLI